jgi:subtilisin family serine protease
MKSKTILKVLAIFLALSMLIGYLPAPVVAKTAVAQQVVTVETAVQDEMNLNGVATYWVDFENSADLSSANFMGWSERGWFVYETLTAQADRTQKAAKDYLDSVGIEYQSFWIANRILVKQSNQTVLSAIQGLPFVTAISAQKSYILYEPEKVDVVEDAKAIEPNITQVQAPAAWELGFDGAGYVVANVDTGVRYSHAALVDSYRGNNGDGTFDHNYNWYNPYNPADNVPRDGNGHGTHTMGTMVGDDGGSNQIGIAPGAQWMACAGCPDGTCWDVSLLGCGQFIAAPTDLTGANADPDMRPNAVNNSWGDCDRTYDPWYADVVAGWQAAGVYPVFSNGNNSNCGYSSPPGLNTVGNPGRYGNVTGVGASGRNNGQYASFSNWGPTDNLDTINPVDGFDMMKPQVIAPGDNIRSSTPGSDTAYQSGWSGTSMSAPHVTGLVAMIWQAAPCMVGDYAATETLIESTATQITYDDGSPLTPTNYPNFATGWGEINALAAVELAASMCGDSTLTGTVTDTDDDPIVGAKVVITGEDPINNRTIYTNAAGEYSVNVNADTYDLVASAFGYTSETEPDVVVPDGQTVTVDFELEAVASTIISGTVTDGGIEATGDLHGYPLYAKLTFTTAGHSHDVYTDPFTGDYSTTILQSSDYTVKVSSLVGEYLPYEDDLFVTSTTYTYDVELLVPEQACGTPGYGVNGVIEEFESGALPAGWANVDYAGTGQTWHFNDPKNRGNKTGGTGGFAMVDSDWYGSSGWQLTGLQTPVMDFSGASAVTLEFDSYLYWSASYPNWGDVYYSTDGGATWEWKYMIPEMTQAMHVTLDLTDELAGESQARIEFLFEGDWAYYWEIDNVSVGDPTCLIRPGGAVAGYVYDANEDDTKLMGAKVETAVNSAVTATFADEAGSGLYWFFEAFEDETEQIEFTVSKNLYETKTEDHELLQDALTHVDFEIGAGHIIANPVELEMTMELGDPDETQILKLENDGSGAASFTISEKDLGFDPLRISIPAFTGELEKSDVLQSIYRDPNASATLGKFSLNSNAETFGIKQAPPAFGVDLLNDSLYHWDDLSIPGAATLVGTPTSGATALFAGDFLGGDFDTLYAVSYDNNGLYAIDTATAAATLIGTTNPPTGTFGGLTGVGDVMYGVTTECNVASTLVTVDLDTAAVTTIGTITNSTCMIDIAYVPSEDAIYGVDLVSNSLHRINIDTGADIIVGQLGVDPNYAQGMDYDEENEILYWASYHTGPDLRIIDITTGASTSVGAFSLGEVDSYSIAAGGGPMDRLPWLEEEPLEGLIAAGEEAEITLTYTVEGIGQPGDYLGELTVKTDTPYPNLVIPVTLHVNRPANYGSIKGEVYAFEKCDINPELAEDVMVKFYQEGTVKYSTMTDENGYFSYAIPAGTYDIEFLLADYVDQLVEGVVLAAGADVVLDDISLRLDAPCLVVEPEALYEELYPGQTSTQILTFTNIGAREAVFEISERPGTGPVPFADNLVLDPGFEAYTPNPYWDEYSAQYGTPLCTVEDCGTGNATGPHTGSAWTWFGGSNSGDTGYMAQDVEIPSGIATMKFWVEQHTCGAGGASTYMALQLDGEEVWRTDGLDPACGVLGYREIEVDVSDFADGGTHEVKFYSVTVGSGNFFLDDVELTVEGGGTPGDIPWLTADPMAGVIMPDGDSVEITINFDATGLLWGDYFAALRVLNDPDPRFDIPVQLRVVDWDWQFLPMILMKWPLP